MDASSPTWRPITWIDPGRAFLAVATNDPAPSGIAFLDSAGPLRDVSRWSVLALDPFETLECRIDPPMPLRSQRRSDRDPFRALDAVLARYRQPKGPIPFSGGGLIGYLGYDLRHGIERLPNRLGTDQEPALWFGLYDALLVFDRRARRAWIVSTGLPERGGRAARLRSVERADALAGRLRRACGAEAPEAVAPLESGSGLSLDFEPSMSPGDYYRAVEEARGLIGRGDIYQVNLSYAIQKRCLLPSPLLYDRLRTLSPAPFGAYLDPGPFQILSNSPERFLNLEDERLETRPIKGTRPRATDPVEDAQQAAELLRSPKDHAEHVMIVDLERNDLGRVARPGSVRVERMAGLESFANVHHLVSIVSARRKDGVSIADILRACFPGGSVTGAPKIRAMEIIEALESRPRGIYTGAIGGIDFSGRLDLSVAIRTAVSREGDVRFQVGGAIVADSKPEAEYLETIAKAEAFCRALTSADGPGG